MPVNCVENFWCRDAHHVIINCYSKLLIGY